MRVSNGRWICYDREKNRLVLGKLDFGFDKQDPVVEQCRKEIPAARSLGWMFSGSMEALTLAPVDYETIDKVVAWFEANYSRYRFGLWLY
jgi:hypothetical protein